jgi:hypothetical protein
MKFMRKKAILAAVAALTLAGAACSAAGTQDKEQFGVSSVSEESAGISSVEENTGADEEKSSSQDTKPMVLTPTPSPEIRYLDGLEGYKAGDVIFDEAIDFNDLGRYFKSYEISDELFARIYGDDKSYKTYCTVPREDLRYLKLLHYGFDGKVYVGELMVNTLLADEVCEIFRILFENRYQIEKMYLIDDYNADDNASIADNNTSAFNYRAVTGGTSLSNHAGGCAIDINPLNNPYVLYNENGELTWSDPEVEKYLDRDAPDAYERHMINHDDLCYKLFAERGWTWGGDWDNPVDYQHFEKVVATYNY